MDFVIWSHEPFLSTQLFYTPLLALLSFVGSTLSHLFLHESTHVRTQHTWVIRIAHINNGRMWYRWNGIDDDVGIFIRKCAQNLWICYVSHRAIIHWEFDIRNGCCVRCRNRYENIKMMTLTKKNLINKFNNNHKKLKRKYLNIPIWMSCRMRIYF